MLDPIYNPYEDEGWPTCPRCGEFVCLESDVKKNGSSEHYVCECGNRFSIEEAV